MLVLQRKLYESIQIDGGIVLTVCEIRGDRVKLGIDAPKATQVKRSELAGTMSETVPLAEYARLQRKLEFCVESGKELTAEVEALKAESVVPQ